MLLGVVSDTHGHVANTQSAVRRLESRRVAAVVYCGDIGSERIPPLFAAWPTHFVLGNVDHNPEELQAAIEQAGLTYHGRMADIDLGGRRIAVIHSDDAGRFRQVIDSGEFDLVCYGHTHLAEQHRVGKTLVLNPGAIYRANPHSIAVVELATMQAEIVSV
jgi:putative phosphoesterase